MCHSLIHHVFITCCGVVNININNGQWFLLHSSLAVKAYCHLLHLMQENVADDIWTPPSDGSDAKAAIAVECGVLGRRLHQPRGARRDTLGDCLVGIWSEDVNLRHDGELCSSWIQTQINLLQFIQAVDLQCLTYSNACLASACPAPWCRVTANPTMRSLLDQEWFQWTRFVSGIPWFPWWFQGRTLVHEFISIFSVCVGPVEDMALEVQPVVKRQLRWRKQQLRITRRRKR